MQSGVMKKIKQQQENPMLTYNKIPTQNSKHVV